MMCAWQELLHILPPWLAKEADGQGREHLEEIRLRLDGPAQLCLAGSSRWTSRTVREEDLKFIVNTASGYSPWAAATVSRGYITAPGGHRIGLCGQAVIKDGSVATLRTVSSVSIRVARDFPGIGDAASRYRGSVLILGPPGSGKTTLLRDVLRRAAERETVGVVDERGEIFPEGFLRGKRMDVLTGCAKADGIDMVLRTMGPGCIGVDEITSEADCEALIRAGWSGVRLIATAHAASAGDLSRRPVYRRLSRSRLFDHILVLDRSRRYHEEEIGP